MGIISGRRAIRSRVAPIKWLALVTVVGVAGATSTVRVPAAQAGPTGFEELSVGEWFGNGRAAGPTTSVSPEGVIDGSGDVTVNMEFAVDVDGLLSGTWDLQGSSFWAVSITAGPAFVIDMTHTASGPMAGTSREFSLGTAEIRTQSVATAEGQVVGNFGSNDRIGPIDLRVSRILCNDAWGEWIASWNVELAEQSYTPTFDGDWYAVRQSAEFSDRDDDLTRQVSERARDLTDRMADEVGSAPVVDGALVLPADSLWMFIYEMVDLTNALRNLTPCDRAVLGDDQVREWTYAISLWVSQLGISLVRGYELDASSLRELAALATAAGAIGEGSVFASSALDDELIAANDAIIADSESSPEDVRLARLTRWQHGWGNP